MLQVSAGANNSVFPNKHISYWSSEIISGIFLLIAVAVSSVSIKAFLIANIHCGISVWDFFPLPAKQSWFGPRK